MNLFEIFKLVFAYMLERKGRVFLTLLGVIVGIFTFTFFIFFSDGLSNAVSEQFNSLGANVLTVKLHSGAQTGPGGDGITEKELNKIKQVVREYRYVTYNIFFNVKVEYSRDFKRTFAVGYPDEDLELLRENSDLKVEQGRDLIFGDRRKLVLGYKFAKDSFDDEVLVGSSLKIDDKSYRVVGILEEQGDLFIDNSVWMSFEDIRDLSGYDTFSSVEVSFEDGVDLMFYKNLIDEKLNLNRGEEEFVVSSSQDVIDQFDEVLGLLTAVVVFVSSVALIVGGVNVMNTMYSNVMERENEISVMKALGAQSCDIRNLFLCESFCLGFVGSLLGFFLAFFLAELIVYVVVNFYGFNVAVAVDFVFLLEVVVGTSLFTAFFGTYPAIKAGRVNPADNLKYD